MALFRVLCMTAAAVAGVGALVAGQQAPQQPPADENIKTLVSRLDLEKYKATLKGLTQFGDRRQGTDRNRAAVDWIEAQLRSYGCTNTARIVYEYNPPAATQSGRGGQRGQGGQRGGTASTGGGTGRRIGPGPGGSFMFGNRGRTGVNTDPNAQPDEKLRALNMQPSSPGRREEVYCTKVGTTHPEEMYIVGGHMDGHGWGEAANDDGSGTALVMELARVLSAPDVKTERSVRFILWNNEETGLNGAHAYVEQRRALQGKEEPAGSGKYPEPRWLGMIQHDMMLFDHGMPGADGKVSPEQRPEADVNVEFQASSKMAAASQALAWMLKSANERYATDYPVTVGPHMTNTDSTPFQDEVAAVSVRENERGSQVGAGWDPHWHQPTDVFSTFSDKDFRLGLNAAQTTLAALAELTRTTILHPASVGGTAQAGTTSKDVPASYVERIPGTNVSIEMVAVPGGTFEMGSPDGEAGRDPDEGPRHQVTVGAFWIGKYEITWDEYDPFAFGSPGAPAAGGAAVPKGADAVTRPTPPYADESFGFGKGRQPVMNITHHAAMEYARWLSQLTGKSYRLPTEAEWEYAARAGSSTPYFFGPDSKALGEYAWHGANAGERPHPVGQKKPNAFGLFDMSGNVAEWCLDKYAAGYYARSPEKNPALLPDDRRYPDVARGGSWADDPKELRSAARRPSTEAWSRRDPQSPQSIWWHTDATIVGFRIARAVDDPALRDVRSKVTRDSPDR